jgi:catechol 2,3-dioxygenase-like lactoylglutathione lyase family enzyme
MVYLDLGSSIDEEIHMNLQPKRIVVTAVNVDHLARAKHFYCSMLNFEITVESPIFVSRNVGDRNASLFRRDQAFKTKYLTDGEIFPHNASGRMHVCFAIDREELRAWHPRLSNQGFPNEGTMLCRGATQVSTSAPPIRTCRNCSLPGDGRSIDVRTFCRYPIQEQ